VTDAVHAAGGLIFQQVMDIGRVANPLFQAGQPPQAPSGIAAQGGKFKQKEAAWQAPWGETIMVAEAYVKPEAIADPLEIIERYRAAFTNSKAAGFDGVELHGANGYLIHQFFDSSSNQRTDSWGGSPENRCRFALEVLKVAIAVFGSSGRVGIKLSPEGGYNDMGMSQPDILATYSYFLQEAAKLKLAYVQVQRWFPVFDPAKRGTIVPVDTWRKLYPTGNLFLNGALTPDEAALLLKTGLADAVLFSRFFITSPDLPERLAKNLPVTEFDWLVAYNTKMQEQGYSTFKTWSEMSPEEQQEVRGTWAKTLKAMEADQKKAQELYEKQEKEAGRVPVAQISL
jgi:2,4-dienoyl-CoA reductase-like NADH-dependent reductase (Old Yellow Enzyme family)